MDNVKRYTISIGGHQYIIVSDEHPETVNAAAQTVDEMVASILHQRSDVPFEKAAVLAALKLAQQSQTLEETVASQRKRSNELVALIDEHM